MAAESKSAQLEKCHLVRCWPDEKCLELCSKLTDLPGHSELETHTVTESQGVDGLRKIVDSVAAKSNTDLILLLLIGAHTVATHKQLIALFSQRERELAATFICVLDPDRAGNAAERLPLADVGVNMVSGSLGQSVQCARQVLSYLHTRPHPSSLLSCPQCRMRKLREDDLRNHFPLYHISSPAKTVQCPICAKTVGNPGKHIYEQHLPPGRKTPRLSAETFHGFSLVVIQRLKDSKFLVVQEFGSLGYWLPAGRVDPNESFHRAAVREAKEEVGIEIRLKGIISISHGRYPGGSMRMEVVFFARPVPAYEDLSPKTVPDYESAGACWVAYEEITKVRVRSKSVCRWIKHVVDGGVVYPLTLLS